MMQVAPAPTASSSTAPPPPADPLERAGKVIDERLVRDERWIGVGDCLTAATSSDYVLPQNPAWGPFQKARSVLLPDRLFEEHDLTNAHVGMGVLPEIDRCWVTVDHRLFLWDWSDNSAISTFEELTDAIVGVGIVKPRPGVFVDSISHLLVLATPNEITLVGLGYSSPSPKAKKEITFYLTGLSVPTDGVSMTTIKGTSGGRIFLSSSENELVPGGIGGDGCLYELVYQSAEGWFVKRCTLYNLTSSTIGKSLMPSVFRSLTAVPKNDWIITIQVDNERGLLYTLLRNGTIEMYQLPSTAPGAGFDGPPNKVAKVSDLLRIALSLCPGSPMLNARKFKVMSLEVINLREGGNGKVGLVAITNNGVRLYFTHQRRGYSYYTVSSQPAALELCHVRPPPAPVAALPPPTTTNFYGQPAPPPQPPASTIPLNNVRQGKYSPCGLYIASNNLTPDVEVLFFAAPDVAVAARAIAEGATGTLNGGPTRAFCEVAGILEVSGSTWDIAEITPAAFAPATGGTALNELATQATMPRREWVVLTNTGVNVVVRQRPVDTLVDVLESAGMNGNGNTGEIGVFFESYGRDQSCSMLLTIAAGNSKLANIDSSSSGANLSGVSRPTTSAVADHAKSLFFEGGGRPVSVDRGGYGSGPQGQASDSKIIFSGRHEGLAFYFARLIRPIWKVKITRASPLGQISNLADAVLSGVQRDLISLRTFIEQEQQLFTLLPDGGRAAQTAGAYQAEQESLNALRLLLIQSVEAISFVLLLIDYKIADIVAACPKDLQTSLLALTYQGLLTTQDGRKIARSLINAVINQQIGKQLSVDVISDTLQQRCGSFCSADDVLMYKAIEAVRRAKDTTSPAERTESLRESLRLFTKATKHLSFERLQEVCAEYNSMHYPQGVIDLALSCARDWDPNSRGVAYWADRCPPNDDRVSSYELRKKCNSLAFDSLAACDDLLNQARQAPTLASNGRSLLSPEEADGLRINAYNKALAVADEFFHFSLYDWFLSRGMTDQLLECRTSHLEAYLSRDPTLEKSDLLWQYYVRTSKYIAAANVLAQLAETQSLPLSIHKRVEYLSLAVSNAKSQFPSSSSQMDTVSFLTDVEEKLEVAQVQVEIYRAIDDSEFNGPDNGAAEKEAWLAKVEERLWNISELYSEFAEPLELLEIVLLIFHVSDHQAPALVQSTWEAILSRAIEAGQETGQPGGSAVRAKVVELGRRFFTSDVAFPVPALVEMLETYSLESRATIELPPGWVPLALREAGTPWEDIWTAMDDMMGAKVPPWHLPASTAFLAADICAMLQAWLNESASTPRNHGIASPFPAASVESALGKIMMSIGGHEEVVGKLRDLQREIRRRY